jgi:hypothetical protein
VSTRKVAIAKALQNEWIMELPWKAGTNMITRGDLHHSLVDHKRFQLFDGRFGPWRNSRGQGAFWGSIDLLPRFETRLVCMIHVGTRIDHLCDDLDHFP